MAQTRQLLRDPLNSIVDLSTCRAKPANKSEITHFIINLQLDNDWYSIYL